MFFAVGLASVLPTRGRVAVGPWVGLVWFLPSARCRTVGPIGLVGQVGPVGWVGLRSAHRRQRRPTGWVGRPVGRSGWVSVGRVGLVGSVGRSVGWAGWYTVLTGWVWVGLWRRLAYGNGRLYRPRARTVADRRPVGRPETNPWGGLGPRRPNKNGRFAGPIRHDM
jgi:hypothetical protein